MSTKDHIVLSTIKNSDNPSEICGLDFSSYKRMRSIVDNVLNSDFKELKKFLKEDNDSNSISKKDIDNEFIFIVSLYKIDEDAEKKSINKFISECNYRLSKTNLYSGIIKIRENNYLYWINKEKSIVDKLKYKIRDIFKNK